MAKEEEKEEAPELSEAERLSLLEKRVGFHRLLVVILGALTVILLSSVITGVIVLNAQIEKMESAAVEEDGEDGGADATPVKGNTGKQLLALKKEQEAQADRLTEIESALTAQRTMENVRQVQQMAEILRQQEQAYRSVMINLKAGMRDLSRMVPGSRTWLEEYEERMDRSVAGSREREGRLKGFSNEPEPEAEP